MNNLMNNKNNFSVNFTKKFKCIGLLVLLATLTGFNFSNAMQEEMAQTKISKENPNQILFDAKTPEEVEKSLAAGANINARDYKGWTFLHFACRNGLAAVALKLIEKGADVNAAATDEWNEGWTPLLIACLKGLTEVALKLIEKEANVNAVVVSNRLYKGCTPLHFACDEGLTQVALMLIEKGVNVNAVVVSDGLYKGCTPLHFACDNDHTKVALMLIEYGANPDAISIYNQTPAQLTNDEEIKKMLNFISQFIKIQDKSSRNKFIEEKTKSGENKESNNFWQNVEHSNMKLGRIRPELHILEKTKAYHDSNVICELERIERNENEEN